MKQIRQGVFETNSSSTHSICVAKNIKNKLELPKEIHFSYGEFGWEHDTLQSTYEKASYLYTALKYMSGTPEIDACLENVISILKNKGIEIIYDNENDEGYIDHGYELSSFINEICNDETKLLNFLFSDLSFIITGNDNSDESVDIITDYPSDIYYKGN